MAAVRPPHPPRRRPRPARTALDGLWALAVAIIAAYAFFVVLGAFSPGDVLAVTIVVALLVVFCLGRLAAARRSADVHRHFF